MSPEPEKQEDGITHEIVRFLAWLKKRGAQQRLIYCRKKWDGKGIDIREICRWPPCRFLKYVKTHKPVW
jgi:hypothetical protein